MSDDVSDQPDPDPIGQDRFGQGPRPGADDVGNVAEEAAKLLGAISDWAKDQSGDLGASLGSLAGHAAAQAQQVGRHLDEGIATGAPECTYCPVCRTVHVVRTLSPEVRAHLTTAAGSLLQAAAALMATAVPPQSGQTGRPPGVERIDLDDNEWPEDDV